jgi:aspartate kinase
MTLIVQKYGGSSMGSLERIQLVARKVYAASKKQPIVVVVSAMQGETDRLLSLAKGLSEKPSGREQDALLASGEQASSALLAIALNELGAKACCYNGAQVPILTDSVHTKATITHISTDNIHRDLKDGYIIIVAGFQGVDEHGHLTTLGRGGSDTSAVALAGALKAIECQIYTDVAGVYTTDPRIVPQARLLSQITFEEMLEMASLGAKVLQIHSVELAGLYQVPLRVLSTFEEGAGTLIALEEGLMKHSVVSGIAFNRDEARVGILGIQDAPGIGAQILGAVSGLNIDVDMIVQNTSAQGLSDLAFTVHKNDYNTVMEVLKAKAESLGARGVHGDRHVAKISLVGAGMRSRPGVATQMFAVLGQEGINIQLVSTSEIKISVLVDEKYLELGVRALHAAFSLDKQPEEERLA